MMFGMYPKKGTIAQGAGAPIIDLEEACHHP
jgi:hypothetical protein